MRAIGVVTTARSDYGIYRPIMRELERRAGVRLVLFVGGAHLLERFGRTVDEIERDGFPIAERVDFLLGDDSAEAWAISIGDGVGAFARAYGRTRPDLLVVVGDRFEMLAAAVAALPLRIPIAHVHGGESTEGAIDESVRHALTKLSHLHFASTEAYAARIVQLGEEPWRVTVSGAPSLDALREFEPVDDERLAELRIDISRPTLLVTYHPNTLAPERTAGELSALLTAVAESGLDAVFTYPGADAGYGEVVGRLEAFAATNRGVTLVRNLGTDAYFTLMSRAAAMVGNSSSGIIEAASFRLPVVDVGERQQGRVRAENVIHVEVDADAILAGIRRVVSNGFRHELASLVNPYGDGRAAERIADVLTTVDLDGRLLRKRFHVL